MIRTRLITSILVGSSLLAAGAYAKSEDAEGITNLLSDAKAEAMELSSDAQTLQSFTRSTPLGWETHSAKLNEMKEHTNKASHIVQQMNDMKSSGSPWQQTAIERITSAMNEMALNLQATIQHLNANQSHVNVSPYKDYAFANAELAEELAGTVSDFANYARTKAKFESLSKKVEIAPSE